VIDVNRDPSGISLYPGQATTELCPTTTFDGEPLYHAGAQPGRAEIDRRIALWFKPYHDALSAELDRLRSVHESVVLYDCHSIRSVIPRLFDGVLPQFNIGTNNGLSCAPELTAAIEAVCDATGLGRVTNGRFQGGFITRHYGKPKAGVHAIQMELSCRGYLAEPIGRVSEAIWPSPFERTEATAMITAICNVLRACIHFASNSGTGAK
jgi:formiminoglutamase